jgi:hypothetical protein
MTQSRRRQGPFGDPLRARLFRDLVLLLLVTVGVLGAAGALLVGDIKRDLAEARIQNASLLVRDEVNGLLLPVQQQLLILRDGLRNQALSPLDVEALNAQLMPALTHMGQIAGAGFADVNGSEYFLRRDGETWVTRERMAHEEDAAPALARVSRWRDAQGVLDSIEQPTEHDPRNRPWFRAAIEALENDDAESAGAHPAGFAWSRPYRFLWLEEPGVTVATAWTADGVTRVLALDVTLARIIETIDRFQLTGAGQGFLFSQEGGVYGSGADEQDAAGFYSAEQQVGGAMVFEAIAAWRAVGEPAERPLRFESGGKIWWAGFVPLEAAERTAWVGVAFPGAGPLGLLQQRWPVFAGLATAILTLGIALAAWVVRRYSHRLRELPQLSVDRTDPHTSLFDLIGRGESVHLEFKSTMRANLHSGKNDKAIELAWLKGVSAFLNTEGGILLLGVADDGEVLGLAADAFANDDKCHLHFKNLVNQHLGAEAMRFLSLTLFRLEDKQIGAVECEPADTPVYLRHGQGESFIIRTGPSNTELSISHALSVIASRFG